MIYHITSRKAWQAGQGTRRIPRRKSGDRGLHPLLDDVPGFARAAKVLRRTGWTSPARDRADASHLRLEMGTAFRRRLLPRAFPQESCSRIFTGRLTWKRSKGPSTWKACQTAITNFQTIYKSMTAFHLLVYPDRFAWLADVSAGASSFPGTGRPRLYIFTCLRLVDLGLCLLAVRIAWHCPK